ncbi:serine/threonine protein phosphatase [Pasteurellaceae bacterium LFhippo2]|nr:serine/threonine protein phosphatase [Pasteurellaceae bacterium LFhippo2]
MSNVTYLLNPPQVSSYAEKVMFKMLFERNLFSKVFNETSWRDDDIALGLGLPTELDGSDECKTVARELFSERMKFIARKKISVPKHLGVAYKNLDRLVEFIELDRAEYELLRFALHLKYDKPLYDLMTYFPKVTLSGVIEHLSSLLKLDSKSVKNSLSKSGKLLSYGLLESSFHPDSMYDYLGWGDTLDFDDFLVHPLNEETLLQNCTTLAEPSTLNLSHFEHIPQRDMLVNYLSQAARQRKKGVNILFYGPPGTGKTELASLLGQELDLATYTMAYMDKDGDVIGGRKRMENCRLAQRLLQDRKGLIVFDEVEDIFSSGLFERSVAQSHKAWMNQLLENNVIPMVWITNSVACIDNAYLRRFDLVIEMDDLPVKNKAKLFKELVGNKFSDDYILHLAKVQGLSPAIIQRGLKVASEIVSPLEPQIFVEQAITIFNQTLIAQGFKKIEPLATNRVIYNLNWVSCRDNIHKISEGLKRTKQGRICCYGPPGTGKTAWANWLGLELGMEVLVRQGSDLLDKYVGGTERNIANAFEQAKQNNMVLVFDEVDTFLFAREGGQKSWEHSQVNEMLTQIEKFEGLLIVSTNLMDGLDPAALRRFDLKLNFDYLNSEQRYSLGIEQTQKLGLMDIQAEQRKRLETLSLLTPGDFAAVARRHRFAAFDSVDEWIDALEDECKLKKGKVSRRIGF